MRSATLPTPPPSLTSLGMKFSDLRQSAGCRSSSKSILAHSLSVYMNVGRQAGSPIARELFARLNKQSNSARVRIALSQTSRSLSNSANSRNLKFLIAMFRLSRASFIWRIGWASAGTCHRDAAYFWTISKLTKVKIIFENTFVPPCFVQFLGILFSFDFVCTR